MFEPEYKHSGNQLQFDFSESRPKTCRFACEIEKGTSEKSLSSSSKKVHFTSTPANICERNVSDLFPSRIKFPRVGIELRIKVNVAEGIDNVCTSRDYFVVNVEFRTKVASHGRMGLRDASRLPN